MPWPVTKAVTGAAWAADGSDGRAASKVTWEALAALEPAGALAALEPGRALAALESGGALAGSRGGAASTGAWGSAGRTGAWGGAGAAVPAAAEYAVDKVLANCRMATMST